VPVRESGPIFAYSFQQDRGKVLVVWSDESPVTLSPSQRELVRRVSAYNMMGARLKEVRSIGSEPVYLVGESARIDAIGQALAAAGGP